MKKQILFCLMALQSMMHSSPYCLDYPPNQHFRKIPLQQTSCNCPCNYRSAHVDKYECLDCGHRLIPKPITNVVAHKTIPKITKKSK